jgi:hypothetical protein
VRIDQSWVLRTSIIILTILETPVFNPTNKHVAMAISVLYSNGERRFGSLPLRA